MIERLSKFIARSGVASRRKAEAIIANGRVKVNNETVLEPFHDIDPDKDHVIVDDVIISADRAQKKFYVALHKPRGYLSDLADAKGRPLARDLITIPGRLYPVGRLDFASEGLIIFTNDGDFAQKVLHPRNQIEKEYLVKMQRPLHPREIELLTTGRRIEGMMYRLCSVRLASLTEKNGWYIITATEGRNRLIRRLAESVGHYVLRLRRVRIGPVMLGSLRPGMYRHLTRVEVEQILQSKTETKKNTSRRVPLGHR